VYNLDEIFFFNFKVILTLNYTTQDK
jgi:hypothetical protein